MFLYLEITLNLRLKSKRDFIKNPSKKISNSKKNGLYLPINLIPPTWKNSKNEIKNTHDSVNNNTILYSVSFFILCKLNARIGSDSNAKYDEEDINSLLKNCPSIMKFCLNNLSAPVIKFVSSNATPCKCGSYAFETKKLNIGKKSISDKTIANIMFVKNNLLRFLLLIVKNITRGIPYNSASSVLIKHPIKNES